MPGTDTEQRTARALLPLYNAWRVASRDGTDAGTVRRLEADLWAKVAEHGLLISTDEILVGRWIAITLDARIAPTGIVVANEDQTTGPIQDA